MAHIILTHNFMHHSVRNICVTSQCKVARFIAHRSLARHKFHRCRITPKKNPLHKKVHYLPNFRPRTFPPCHGVYKSGISLDKPVTKLEHAPCSGQQCDLFTTVVKTWRLLLFSRHGVAVTSLPLLERR